MSLARAPVHVKLAGVREARPPAPRPCNAAVPVALNLDEPRWPPQEPRRHLRKARPHLHKAALWDRRGERHVLGTGHVGLLHHRVDVQRIERVLRPHADVPRMTRSSAWGSGPVDPRARPLVMRSVALAWNATASDSADGSGQQRQRGTSRHAGRARGSAASRAALAPVLRSERAARFFDCLAPARRARCCRAACAAAAPAGRVCAVDAALGELELGWRTISGHRCLRPPQRAFTSVGLARRASGASSSGTSSTCCRSFAASVVPSLRAAALRCRFSRSHRV
jgi:hypothetical protein